MSLPLQGRCAIHDLGAGPDGRCVLCRRSSPPRPSADGWVKGAVAVLVLTLAGAVGLKMAQRTLQARAAQEAAHAAGAPSNPVRLYTTSWCPHCARAKRWLDGQHVDYVALDIESDPWAQREIRRLNPRGSIPTFDAYGEVVVGFEPQEYATALARGAQRSQGAPAP
jgi:glutaredoxin